MNIYKCLFVAMFLLGCISCGDDEIKPDASFNISSTNLVVGETVILTKTGQGEFFIAYMGDEGRVYGEPNSEGVPSNSRGVINYSYRSAGNYTVTFLVSTYEEGEIFTDVSQAQVVVTDTSTSLSSVRLSTLKHYFNRPDAAFQFMEIDIPLQGDNNLMFPVYHYSRFWQGVNERENDEPVISISQLGINLSIEASSESSTIIIDDENYGGNVETGNLKFFDFRNRYVPKEVEVRAPSGATSVYNICPVIIPEMASVAVDGSPEGIVRLHPFDTKTFFASLPIAVGQDKLALSVDFTTFYPDDSEVLIGQSVQSSGDLVNFSGVVKYDVTYNQPSFEEEFQLTATTYVAAIETPLITDFSINNVQGVFVEQDASSPKIYFVNLTLPTDTDLSNLKPTFLQNLNISDVVVTASTGLNGSTNQGVQVSNVNELDFGGYQRRLDQGDFRADDYRVEYIIRNQSSEAEATLPNTLADLYYVETIYKVGVVSE